MIGLQKSLILISSEKKNKKKPDRYYVVTHRDRWQRTECPSKTIHHDSCIALFSYFQIYTYVQIACTFSDMVQGLLQLQTNEKMYIKLIVELKKKKKKKKNLLNCWKKGR